MSTASQTASLAQLTPAEQVQQDYTQLANALQSNDLTTAQSAFAAVAGVLQGRPGRSRVPRLPQTGSNPERLQCARPGATVRQFVPGANCLHAVADRRAERGEFANPAQAWERPWKDITTITIIMAVGDPPPTTSTNTRLPTTPPLMPALT